MRVRVWHLLIVLMMGFAFLAATTDTATTGPDVVEIDEVKGVLSEGTPDVFGPVRFTHAAHARMEEGANGCVACHHNNPEGQPMLACKECHVGASDDANLQQPGLKGAYHRQCLGCHREWANPDDCTACHAKIGEMCETPIDPTDIVDAKDHMTLGPPSKVFYETPKYRSGPTATFYHDEHVGLFELECTACHKQEDCGSCHKMGKREPKRHANCMECHELQNECEKCHGDKELPRFEHGGSTGLTLDEEHAEAECASCHTDGVRAAATCAECHDDDFTYPENVPGERVAEPGQE